MVIFPALVIVTLAYFLALGLTVTSAVAFWAALVVTALVSRTVLP